MVYDDFFETVHADDQLQPTEWEDLLVFQSFRSDIDEEEEIPNLPDEWLNPDELKARTQEQAVRRQPESGQDTPKQREPEQITEPGEPNPSEPLMPPTMPPRTQQLANQREPPTPKAPAPSRPERMRRPPKRYGFDGLQHEGSPTVTALCGQMAIAMVGSYGLELDIRYILALLTDADHGTLEGLPPWIMGEYSSAMKASKAHDPDTPTYHEALSGPHRQEFQEAMAKEIQELEEHGTWKVIERSSLPRGANVLPSTWAFKVKRFPDGRMRKFKARFCVRGDRQIEGVDYFEKYSPVVSWSTVRMMLCVAASQGLATRQVDFSNAFVQAKLSEDVYIETPKGFEADGDKPAVLKLNKSLYGLVQAPMCWGNHLKAALERRGFRQSTSDPCLYVGDDMMVLTYVDDCLFFGKCQDKIDKMIQSLQEPDKDGKPEFSLTIEDDIFAFLGVEVVRHKDGDVELRQLGLIDKVLKYCGMSECNKKATPCGLEPLHTDKNGPACQETWSYAAAVGMLMYLSSNSRPDIQFAVHQCARFTHAPRRSHEVAIQRICRYLQGTKDKGMRFTPTKELKIDCYVDADFAGLWNVEDDQDPVCVKSRTGYCLTLGECPVIWVSKLQTEVALSTTEAEYIALSQSMRELLPMRRLLQEIIKALELEGTNEAMLHSTVFEDNNGALSLATAPKMTPRTKHIAVKYHHFRSHVGKDKGIEIVKIDTAIQKADIFTKGLAAEKFQALRRLIMGW